jgi:hypothetical protein
MCCAEAAGAGRTSHSAPQGTVWVVFLTIDGVSQLPGEVVGYPCNLKFVSQQLVSTYAECSEGLPDLVDTFRPPGSSTHAERSEGTSELVPHTGLLQTDGSELFMLTVHRSSDDYSVCITISSKVRVSLVK